LLHSKTPADLICMCQSIFLNLKPGGILVSVNDNPDDKPPYYSFIKYGWEKINPKDNIRNEGDQVEVRHFNTNGTEFVIKHFHWNKSTYEMALFRAGLSTVEFHRAQIAPVAAKADNEKYWDDFLAYNEIMFIKATKADS